jgi:hypothetical protein
MKKITDDKQKLKNMYSLMSQKMTDLVINNIVILLGSLVLPRFVLSNQDLQ